MQFQKSGLRPSCQIVPSLHITRGLARTTHGKLVWMLEKYAQQFWGCQEKKQRLCASVSARKGSRRGPIGWLSSPARGSRLRLLVSKSQSDAQKVTDEGIRDQQVSSGAGMPRPFYRKGRECNSPTGTYSCFLQKRRPRICSGAQGREHHGHFISHCSVRVKPTIYYSLFTNTIGRSGGCSVGERQGTALPSRPALHHQTPLLRAARSGKRTVKSPS